MSSLTEVRIRRARPEDYWYIQYIYATVHPCPEGDLNRPPWSAFEIVVAEDVNVVGFASSLLFPEMMFLVETLVLPAYQGQGIGRRLNEARLELGTALGLQEALCITCDGSAPQSRHILKTLGFEPDDFYPLKESLLAALTKAGQRNPILHSRPLGGWA